MERCLWNINQKKKKKHKVYVVPEYHSVKTMYMGVQKSTWLGLRTSPQEPASFRALAGQPGESSQELQDLPRTDLIYSQVLLSLCLFNV